MTMAILPPASQSAKFKKGGAGSTLRQVNFHRLHAMESVSQSEGGGTHHVHLCSPRLGVGLATRVATSSPSESSKETKKQRNKEKEAHTCYLLRMAERRLFIQQNKSKILPVPPCSMQEGFVPGLRPFVLS